MQRDNDSASSKKNNSFLKLPDEASHSELDFMQNELASLKKSSQSSIFCQLAPPTYLGKRGRSSDSANGSDKSGSKPNSPGKTSSKGDMRRRKLEIQQRLILSIRHNNGFGRLDLFRNLLNALQQFFADKNADGYEACTVFGKRLFGMILVKKFGRRRLESCTGFYPDSKYQLGAEAVRELAQQISPVRMSNMQSKLIKDFVDFRVFQIERQVSPVVRLTKTQKHCLRLEFLIQSFPSCKKSPSKKTEVKDAFFKPRQLYENTWKDYRLYRISKNWCRIGDGLLEPIQSEPSMLRSFQEFLQVAVNPEVLAWFKRSIRRSAKSLFKKMLTQYKCSKISPEAYLKHFQFELSNSKFKLPLHMTDLEHYSMELSRRLKKSCK